jgi:hypothetical protein
MWSSGRSSWLQIQRSGFDSPRYEIFWEVVGLERDLLSLVTVTEKLLVRKSSGSGLENREYGHGHAVDWLALALRLYTHITHGIVRVWFSNLGSSYL